MADTATWHLLYDNPRINCWCSANLVIILPGGIYATRIIIPCHAVRWRLLVAQYTLASYVINSTLPGNGNGNGNGRRHHNGTNHELCW